ncbi:MAG: hypothetical protein QOE68_409 [Thermoanaerobaculia bacterium]|jgi:hypothetical protein|nr:hypothetical protein [Thermoanaerobaculia bacterium]
MRKTMTLALAVLLAFPLLAGDAAVDELVIEAKDRVHDYSLTPPDSIGGVIESALPAGSARELITIVRERFGLKEETARLITIAVLRNLIAEGGAHAESDEARQEVRQTLDRDYAEALRSEPSNAAVAREYLALLADDDNRFLDNDRRVREVLRGLPRDQRGLVALQVMSDLRIGHGNPALFEVATEAYGLDPLALAIIGDELTSSSAAEIFDRATSLWLAQNDVESAAAAASRAIYAYANRRSLADVLRIYRSLPAEGRAIVSRAPAAEATVRSRGVDHRIGTRDIRFTLAAAFILAGDDRAARALVPAGQLKKDDAAVAAVLMAAIDSPGGDAFDLVTNYLQNVGAQSTALVDEVFDRVATRAGYTASSKWRLDTVTHADERQAAVERNALPSAAATLLPACEASFGPTKSISPAVERLLNRAPLVPFVERAVDDSDRSSDFDAASRIVRPLPAGFDFLRMESHGDDVVAVASSQSVDPSGAASVGGYWILRSTDRGGTWNRPLYTGLRVLQPYEVVIGSTLPMLRDDGVRIEVATTEIDGPIKELLAVDFKWRDLERDSDGDGLTDLVEERILTDPQSADTDSDGLADGVDPLPQVAFRQSQGDAAKIVATAIEAYYGSAIVQMAGEHGLGTTTMFIVGDPADFAGVTSRVRIIVTSEGEIEAASKKFGPTLAMHISLVIIDQTGTRAWVQLNDEGSGATYLLEKKEGAWIALAVASWVS